jgi:photosystem II biogenesis protein Psp29
MGRKKERPMQVAPISKMCVNGEGFCPLLLLFNAIGNSVNTVPTLSDTKRRFYKQHTRPISSIYRRFLEEMMVEMHLLWVNKTFVYDAVYALGVVTTFDRFMEGYQPSQDIEPIFAALCAATEAQSSRYRTDAEQLVSLCQGLSVTDLQDALEGNGSNAELTSLFNTIATNKTFKYSRLFGIGLTSLLAQGDEELLHNKDRLMEILEAFATGLGLPSDKLKKDVELYLSNLEKMGQARLLMEEMVATERKRREQREQEKQAKQAMAEEEAATGSTNQSEG